MRHKDIPECVALVASHPVLAPRYDKAINLLGNAWSQLLRELAFLSLIFEEGNGSTLRKVGLGTRAFLSDTFVQEMKTAPYFWAGPELVRRVLAGCSPLLTDKQVREANAHGGLNLFVWDGTASANDINRPEVIHTLFFEFVDQHRGFLLKEVLAQSSSSDILEAQLHSGGFLLDETGRYTSAVPQPMKELVQRPHYIGVSRELALQQYGSWISSMFIHQPPRFGFRPSEQRLLIAALEGGTDEQLSNKLGVSISAVKKTWLLIYERVAARDLGLIPNPDLVEDESPERGKTKKQLLLAYLRNHMQEVRPFARI